MNKPKVCCICGKEIIGYGNNPDGTLDYRGRKIQWKKNDVCCDKCNMEKVIPGRLSMLLGDRD